MDKPGVLRVAIACNIKTDHTSEADAEFDEPETIEAISTALRNGGFETIVLDAADQFPRKLIAASPDIVFNIAEGRSGRSREAQVPAILEYYGVPYSGSDAAALSVSLDKAMTKRLAQSCGVETPAFCIITRGAPELSSNLPDGLPCDLLDELPGGLRFPVIVKPNAEGSGKGITDDCVAEDMPQLSALTGRLADYHEGGLLAEQYIGGREFTVGILGNGSGLRVLEPMEIIYRQHRGPYNIYSCEVKRNFREYVDYSCPPDIPPALVNKIKSDAITVYNALGCMDFARADFRLSADGRVYFIEINPLPGLRPHYSDFPILAEYNGINYGNLIRTILGFALDRYGMRRVVTRDE